MATNKLSATILIFSLLFFTTSSIACGPCTPKPTPPKQTPPKPTPPKPTPPKRTPCEPTAPPVEPPVAPPPSACPIDTLKLGTCADLLGLVNVIIGTPPTSSCCSVLEGLADLEVADCLCTAIKANVLGINLNVPIALDVLVSACEKTIPPGFKCE